MSYLRTIKRFSAADNLGGLLTLQIARKDDIESIPYPTARVITGNIVFKAGKGFVTWEVKHDTLSLKSNSRPSREGISKQNRLPFVIPKDRFEILLQLEMAEDDEFIVLYTDTNGNTKLFGTLEVPVLFEFSHDTGGGVADLNAYACRFYSDGPDNTNFYAGTVTQQPAGTAPAIVMYSTGEIVASLNPSDILEVNSDFAHTFAHIPGLYPSATPAVVRWDDGTLIASLQPGDILIIETDFEFDFELIGTI